MIQLSTRVHTVQQALMQMQIQEQRRAFSCESSASRPTVASVVQNAYRPGPSSATASPLFTPGGQTPPSLSDPSYPSLTGSGVTMTDSVDPSGVSVSLPISQQQQQQPLQSRTGSLGGRWGEPGLTDSSSNDYPLPTAPPLATDRNDALWRGVAQLGVTDRQ